jgi:hypothetical protein
LLAPPNIARKSKSTQEAWRGAIRMSKVAQEKISRIDDRRGRQSGSTAFPTQPVQLCQWASSVGLACHFGMSSENFDLMAQAGD